MTLSECEVSDTCAVIHLPDLPIFGFAFVAFAGLIVFKVAAMLWELIPVN